jgi:ABC-2 type transport system ATP-binding protein
VIAGDAPALDCEGVHTAFPGGVEALTGLDLAIPEGSSFGLLGPDGAGKTRHRGGRGPRRAGAFIRGGRIVADGPPHDLRERFGAARREDVSLQVVGR